MAIDLAYSPEIVDLARRTREFIRDNVLPIENRYGGDTEAAGTDKLRRELQSAAKQAGAPRLPAARLRWTRVGHVRPSAVIRSRRLLTLRPHSAQHRTPDEGSAHLLERVATD